MREVDAAVAAVERTAGAGSEATRRSQLEAVLSRATAPEAEFIRRLFTGELRQGALDGLMAVIPPAAPLARALVLQMSRIGNRRRTRAR